MIMRHERSFAIVHLKMNFRSFLSLYEGILHFVMVFIEEITFTLFKMLLKVWFFLAANTIVAFGELMLGCLVEFFTRDLRYVICLMAMS